MGGQEELKNRPQAQVVEITRDQKIPGYNWDDLSREVFNQYGNGKFLLVFHDFQPDGSIVTWAAGIFVQEGKLNKFKVGPILDGQESDLNMLTSGLSD